MHCAIKIKMDNAAFEGFPGIELARILRDMAAEVEKGYTVATAVDINGNKVGQLTIIGK